MGRWPELDNSGALTHRDKTECGCCDKPATHFVNVRHGPMCGSDIDTYTVCARHERMARSGLNRFFAHMRTKGEFLGRVTKERGDG